MSSSDKDNSMPLPPSLRLTRRSLIAAAGLLASIGPPAAGRALANRRHRDRDGDWDDGDKKHKCLLGGTRVLTPTGEVRVEDLEIGDLVVTESGVVREIRWIGKTSIERDGNSPWADHVRPIRISKGALGGGRPHRDLYLSRAHMLHLGGVLIPVSDLVNGANIAAVDVASDRIEYFHIALDRHDVLVAEGAPCESLLVTADRKSAFDNGSEPAEKLPAEMVPCAQIAAYNGGRGALASRLRSALAPVIDLRRPADIVRDGVEERALLPRAA